MSRRAGDGPVQVTVVGGGLAGLAAAVALATENCQVELFEARRSLGGRAGSFRDPATDELVDHCQHVSMRCCTNLADFCRRTQTAHFFRRDRRLHFIGPDGRHYPLQAAALPAPMHLAPALWKLKYLSAGERLKIGRAMWKLMRLGAADRPDAPTAAAWLRQQGQSVRAIEHFWSVILISALGEELERASLAAARKVLVDGFLAARDAYVVEVPQAPLSAIYGDQLERWFLARGVRLHLSAPVRRVSCDTGPLVELADGRQVRPDFVVIALPWFKIAEVLDQRLASQWPWLDEISKVEASPITGVHLWFDRSIMSLEHAVLVGRLSQWIFHRTGNQPQETRHGYYYQVVVSASRALAGKDREAIVAEVCRELAQIWPAAGAAKLLAARVVTEHAAVFSARPGLDQLRPAQKTPTCGVLVAGDWTATTWPATMESAVRSGYLAAEAILEAIGRPRRCLVNDLPRGWLARWLIRD
ncbi:MAG: hydroxysqualene dehydroxylase HpnE [Pirellulales bacterium]